jgi:hypothetical protein
MRFQLFFYQNSLTMKKYLLFGLSMILGLTLFVFSCDKDEDALVLVGKQQVEVKNGMLYFKNFEEFSSLYKYLLEDPKRLQEMDAVDFISANKAFDLTTQTNMNKPIAENIINQHVSYWDKDKEGEVGLKRIFKDPYRGALYNENGVVQVGKDILKVDLENLYVIESKSYQPNMSLENNPDVKIVPKKIDAAFQKCESTGICNYVYAYKNGNQWKRIYASVSQALEEFYDPINETYY